MAARNAVDPDFVICARCDLIGAEDGSFEGAIERALLYVKEAGVDLIWMNSMHSREEIREVCARIPAPVMVSYYGPPPTPTLDEFRSRKQRAACCHSHAKVVTLAFASGERLIVVGCRRAANHCFDLLHILLIVISKFALAYFAGHSCKVG